MKNKTKKVAYLMAIIIFSFNTKVGYAQCASAANIFTFTAGSVKYELVKESRTWTVAAECAATRGGYLVQIDNATEQTDVYNGIISSGISPTYNPVFDGGGASYVWIGATDRHTEGTWLWDGNNDGVGTNFWNGEGVYGNIGTGSVVAGAYNNWGTDNPSYRNEPDDFSGSQDAGAIALAKWPSVPGFTIGLTGQWNDISESNTLYYIIEYPPVTTPTIVATSDGTICAGSAYTFTVSGASSYTINPSAQTFTASVAVTPTTTTTYTIIGSNGAATAEIVRTVNVNASPTINVTSSSTTINSGQSVTLTASGASSFTLNTTLFTTTIAVTPTLTTTYTVTGASAAGCISSKTVVITVVNPTSIFESNKGNLNIDVYPNPVSSQLYIEGRFTSILLTNIVGKRINIPLIKSDDKIMIDMSTLPNGVYFVTCTDLSNNQATRKILLNNTDYK